MVSIFFVGGIIIALLGIIGIYLGRTYDEAKNRPLYRVSDCPTGVNRSLIAQQIFSLKYRKRKSQVAYVNGLARVKGGAGRSIVLRAGGSPLLWFALRSHSGRNARATDPRHRNPVRGSKVNLVTG